VDLESSQLAEESVAVHLTFPTEQNPNDCDEICGSCDGLLLIGFMMEDECFHYSLVNPATREFKILPQSPFTFDPWKCFNDYGLGYDSSNDDYKVVSISHYGETPENVVSIYALRTNSWKQIEKSPCDHSSYGHKSGVFVSGALHWIAITSGSEVIVALDLADEKFRIMPSPNPVGDKELAALGGCLCVSSKRYNDFHADVWVMKDYGVGESWTKFRVNCNSFHASWKPLSSSRTDRVLFNVKHKKLVLFDLQEEKFKELVVRGHPTFFEAETYVESLVSPNWQC